MTLSEHQLDDAMDIDIAAENLVMNVSGIHWALINLMADQRSQLEEDSSALRTFEELQVVTSLFLDNIERDAKELFEKAHQHRISLRPPDAPGVSPQAKG
jgi:hypothetical protein